MTQGTTNSIGGGGILDTLQTQIASKQDKLTAGDNITISENTISASSSTTDVYTCTGDEGLFRTLNYLSVGSLILIYVSGVMTCIGTITLKEGDSTSRAITVSCVGSCWAYSSSGHTLLATYSSSKYSINLQGYQNSSIYTSTDNTSRTYTLVKFA